MTPVDRPVRPEGDDTPPICGDRSHRHNGPCEFWAREPAPWAEDIFEQLGHQRMYRAICTHRPTGISAAREGDRLDGLIAAARADLVLKLADYQGAAHAATPHETTEH